MNVFQDFHNDRTSEEAINRFNRYKEYIEGNFLNLQNKEFENDNYHFSYRVIGDVMLVVTTFKDNNNKMEMILFAHNEKNEPEEEIKLWYNTVFTTNEIKQENTETTNLLDEIYQKYPNLKDKEGIICTDNDSYWLLDKEGKKIYFQDLDSFEKAFEQSGLEMQSIGEDTNNNSREVLNNSDNSSNSISNNYSNDSDSTVNNNYSQETSSQQDSNYANNSNQMPSNWNTNVLIPNEFKVSYNGKVCIADSNAYSHFGYNGYYLCCLEEPKKNNGAKEGAKYYLNGKSLENGIFKESRGNRYAYKYTFNNIKNVTFKIVAPYLYDVDS